MTRYDTSKTYIQYNEDVLSGRILASHNIILACRRFKERFSRDDMYFDYADVDKRVHFVSKMKQFKERYSGLPLILLPWQEWVFANIFGFKWSADDRRVTTKVLLFVARKAGKTALAAALCLVQLFMDDNDGQEIDLIGNSGKQAALAFEYVTKFGQSLDPRKLILKPYRDTLKMPHNSSFISVRNSDSMTLDGLNASTFIYDEFHAAKNWKLYNVLKSSQGFQTNPLAIVITTAGYLLDGFPLWEMRKACVSILEGTLEDEAQFSALYELDEGDDWEDESNWIKANPAIGQTVTLTSLKDDYISAKNIPGMEPEFKSKHMNIFCADANQWLDPEDIRPYMQPIDLSLLAADKKDYVYGAVDLSTTTDLTCFTFMWAPNTRRSYYPDKYIFSTRCYVTEQALKRSPNRELYAQWIKDGHLNLIKGNAIDYDIIQEDITKYKQYARIDTISYDQWNSSQFVINCTNAGFNMQAFSQKIGSFNAPTKEFERLLFTEQVIIEYNPLVLWAFNNVVLAIQDDGVNDNVKPSKASNENKIDPVITIVQSLGTYMYVTGKMGGGDTEIYFGGKNK